MFLSRFNHAAACEVAIEHARALHRERVQLSLAGLFDESEGRREIDRRVAALELRENALLRFAEDPYAADSLQRIFDPDDRARVLNAGDPQSSATGCAARAA